MDLLSTALYISGIMPVPVPVRTRQHPSTTMASVTPSGPFQQVKKLVFHFLLLKG